MRRAPYTTADTIVFLLKRNNTYDSSQYSPALTDGRATHQEIDQVLQEIQAIRTPYASNVLKASTVYFLIQVMSVVSFIFLLVNSSGQDTATIVIYCCFVTIISIFHFRYCLRMKRELIGQTKVAVDKINQYFLGRGLRWNLPPSFPMWIELKKEYMSQPQNQFGYGMYPPAPQTFPNYQQGAMPGFAGNNMQYGQNQQPYYGINQFNNSDAYHYLPNA